MNILVVDDSKTMRYLIQQTLRGMGIREECVLLSESGEQALDIMRRAKVHFMILDWHLGGMSGLDVLRVMRKEGLDDIAVVMLTTEQKRKNIELAVESGAHDYIIKPIEPATFRKKILAVARQAGLDPYDIRKPSHTPSSTKPAEPATPVVPRVSEKEWRDVEKTIARLEESGALDNVDSEMDAGDIETSLNEADDALAHC